jgi:hypothetical protein
MSEENVRITVGTSRKSGHEIMGAFAPKLFLDSLLRRSSETSKV